jgi:hypothetical protein
MFPPVLHDLRALAELASHGMDLEYERVHLSATSPLTDALASRVSFGNLGAETYVLYANGRKARALGVVQARSRKNRPEADITFIAPSLESDPDAVTTWYRLLAEATRGLGELGCHRIYAQIPSGNGAEEVFRQAGFSTFTHADVYLLMPERAAALKTHPLGPGLRRMRKRDAWNVLALYSAITPRNVQLSEAMITTEGALGKLEDWWETSVGTSYIFERDNQLVGLARIARGRLASWVRLHLHPDAQPLAEELVAEAVALVSKSRTRPIYVGVRDYESGIRPALENVGFEWQVERSHMVKHTTVRVRESVTWLTPVLDSPKIPAIHTTRHAQTVGGGGQVT